MKKYLPIIFNKKFLEEKNKNGKIKYLIINELINLMEDINIKEIFLKMKIQEKQSILSKKIFNCDEQLKSKAIETLTPKKMF